MSRDLFGDAQDGDQLEGTVAREVFRSETFAVLRVRTDAGGLETVTGPLPAAQPGERIVADGQWVEDPRHGRQFKAAGARFSLPESSAAITRYLSSGAIEGVGPTFAERIVEAFGEDTVRVMDEEPDRLLEVKGIGRSKLKRIKASWSDQRAGRDTMLFLRGHGVGAVLAARIQAKFGVETRRRVEEDPYQLAREVEGVGFQTADKLARALGIEDADPRRLRAGLLHVANEALSQGDTCLPADALTRLAGEALRAAPDDLEPALHEARSEGALELDRSVGEEDLVYLPQILRAERSAARLTLGLIDARVARRVPRIDLEQALDWLSQRDLLLSGAQRVAIRASCSEPLTVVTGGPGVGKTTVVRALVELLKHHQVGFALAAPTGRAAKRLEEATGAEAKTLHRLLEWDPRGGGFGRNAAAPLEVDLLVVDEASMVDIRLYHALIRALPTGASLVMIGDVDQLPSVGPGSVLNDLIQSGGAEVVRLTEVFRQAARSRIVSVAHSINAGLMPDLSADPDADPAEVDFFFVPRRTAEATRKTIVKLIQERIPARFGLDPITDVMVLAPMHRGTCGTEELNRTLKAALNPGAGEEAWPPAAGDKVMQLKNDYEHEVFNGDLGRVVSADGDGTVVDFDGRRVLYTRGERSSLALAYCATIHKAQGSEYPAVVIPLLTEQFVMLQRNLIYTALTRARRLAVLVGQPRAVELAVKNDQPRRRRSLLGARVAAGLSVD